MAIKAINAIKYGCIKTNYKYCDGTRRKGIKNRNERKKHR